MKYWLISFWYKPNVGPGYMQYDVWHGSPFGWVQSTFDDTDGKYHMVNSVEISIKQYHWARDHL